MQRIVDLMDERADRLRERLDETYGRAVEAMQERFVRDLAEYDEEARKMRLGLEHHTVTPPEYEQWATEWARRSQRTIELERRLALDLTETDRMANEQVNAEVPGAFAEGVNLGTYTIEGLSGVDTSFTLYDRRIVAELVENDPDLLPKATFRRAKDYVWNLRHVTAEVTQGILRGDPVQEVAKRLGGVAKMSEAASLRAARTAMTSASNLGASHACRRAQSLGISVRHQWLATLDGRTRDSHRMLDGEVRELGEEFLPGLAYPGDPHGDPSEVWCCRCALVPVLPDVETDEVTRAGRLGDMTYEEWREEARRRANG